MNVAKIPSAVICTEDSKTESCEIFLYLKPSIMFSKKTKLLIDFSLIGITLSNHVHSREHIYIYILVIHLHLWQK